MIKYRWILQHFDLFVSFLEIEIKVNKKTAKKKASTKGKEGKGNHFNGRLCLYIHTISLSIYQNAEKEKRKGRIKWKADCAEKMS